MLKINTNKWVNYRILDSPYSHCTKRNDNVQKLYLFLLFEGHITFLEDCIVYYKCIRLFSDKTLKTQPLCSFLPNVKI